MGKEQKSEGNPAPTAQASVATTDPVAPTTLATEQSGAASRESSDLGAESRGPSDVDAQVVRRNDIKNEHDAKLDVPKRGN